MILPRKNRSIKSGLSILLKNKKGAGFLILLLYAAALYFLSLGDTPVLPKDTLPICLYSNQAGGSLRTTIRDAINAARFKVTCIIYSLTDEEILYALKTKSEQGVKVTVVCDAVASLGVGDKLGPKVTCIPVRKRGLMHNKLVAIDETSAYLGSSNFTRDSLILHANLVLGIHSPEVAKMIEEKAKNIVTTKPKKIAPLRMQTKDESFELYFLPDAPETLARLHTLLSGAAKSVKVAMFTFTHPQLTQTLIDLHRKGVAVQVVLDSDSSRKTSRIAYERFKREHMDVRVSKRSGLLHEKVAIVDDAILVGGSTNWTKAAFTVNEEHLFILSNLSQEHKETLRQFWQTTLQEATSQEATGK